MLQQWPPSGRIISLMLKEMDQSITQILNVSIVNGKATRKLIEQGRRQRRPRYEI
jgi:hypothetical protein